MSDSGELAPRESAPTAVIVSSVHDYRMARRASIQAVADAFHRAGFRTVFLSVRFSALSLVKSDPRSALHGRANRFERVNGIECYLWRTPLHPFATGSAQGNRLTAPLHDLYASWPSADVDGMFRSADVIVVESGLGVLLIRRMRRLNPRALLVYRAADALETIGAHPMLQRRLEESASLVDHYCLVAEGMAPQFAFARARTFIVPRAGRQKDSSDATHEALIFGYIWSPKPVPNALLPSTRMPSVTKYVFAMSKTFWKKKPAFQIFARRS